MPNHRITKKIRLSTKGDGLQEIETFQKQRSKTYYLKNNNGFLDFDQFFKHALPILVCKLKELRATSSYKFNLYDDATYENNLLDENRDVSFKTINEIIYASSKLKPLLNKMLNELLEKESNFLTKGSGWSLKSIDGLQLRTNKVNLLKGSSYIKLPSNVQNKLAVINVKNTDTKCFKYAILSKYTERRNKNKFSTKHFNFLEKTSGLNFNCIDFPTPLMQIKKFERTNNVSVNVYGLDNKNEIYPLYVGEIEKIEHFDLLFLKTNKTSYYCFINNFSRLVRSQKTNYCSKLIICKKCFVTFSDKPNKNKTWGWHGLNEHKKFCNKHKIGKPVIVEDGD